MRLDPALRFRVAPDVHWRKFGSELVLLHLSDGEYFSLDELGARVWERLAAGHTIGRVAAELAPEYEVDDEAFRADFEALVADLSAKGLLFRNVE
jgi:hypothetical protein